MGSTRPARHSQENYQSTILPLASQLPSHRSQPFCLALGPLSPLRLSPFCPSPALFLGWFLLSPQIPYGLVLGRKFRGIIHECRDRVTYPPFVCRLQTSHHLFNLRRR